MLRREISQFGYWLFHLGGSSLVQVLGAVEQLTSGGSEPWAVVRQLEWQPGQAGAPADGHVADLARRREVFDSSRQGQVQAQLPDPGAVGGHQHAVGVVFGRFQVFYHSE